MKDLLRGKIVDRSLRIAIIGLGYIGLPLAITFAEAGFHVVGIDIDSYKVSMVNNGKSYIIGVADDELQEQVNSGKLYSTDNFRILKEIDAVSICVPTPLHETCDPDFSYIISATQEVKKYLHPGQLIVLESTTYPGTTDELLLSALETTGLKVGIDFYLAFSPERIDPGNLQFRIKNTPKIVGGTTSSCVEIAQLYYNSAIQDVIPVSSTRVAEMAKLLENIFRSVNIGLINEIAIICDKLCIDTWEVIDAAATKPFGFLRFLPGPGIGGHCIPVDPHYLSWKLKTLNFTSRFIELAADINSKMPYYIVDKISEVLNKQKRCLNGSTILILGVAYKKNIGDIRESPSIEIIHVLLDNNVKVLYNDDYISSIYIKQGELKSQQLNSNLLQEADCVVIITDHDYYDVNFIITEAKSILDARNITKGYQDDKIFRI